MVLMGLGPLIAAIDELVGTDAAGLADPHTIVELHRQLDRLQAVTTRASASFDASQAWQASGARTAASWLSVLCHLPKPAAKREVGVGRGLRHLPACETAWLAGDISADHVRVLNGVRRPATAERLATDEAMLVGHAKDLSFGHFVKVVAYWAQHADPDGEDENAADERDARQVHLSKSFGGMWFANATLDRLSGTIIAKELGRIERELFRADWAEAKERLGRDPRIDELPRTPAQRRADALVEMAVRSATAPKDGRRPAPLFTVLVGWETLHGRICELSDGTVVAPRVLLPWLDAAWLERMVFDGPSRVIDVGVCQRLFSGATRRAVEVRDQQCFHEFCDAPADECDVDHVVPYSAGGPTVQQNGRLACGFHNRARHKPRPDP